MSESGQLDVSRYSLDDAQNRTMTVRNCLISGASGLIGRVLCAFLQGQGCKVRALLRRQTEGPWDDAVFCDLGYGSE